MKSQNYAVFLSLVDIAKFVFFFQKTILERTLSHKWRNAFNTLVFITHVVPSSCLQYNNQCSATQCGSSAVTQFPQSMLLDH